MVAVSSGIEGQAQVALNAISMVNVPPILNVLMVSAKESVATTTANLMKYVPMELITITFAKSGSDTVMLTGLVNFTKLVVELVVVVGGQEDLQDGDGTVSAGLDLQTQVYMDVNGIPSDVVTS